MRDSGPRLTQEDIFAHEFAEREEKPRVRRERTQTEDGEDVGMERFRIQVGHEHGVTPREIVGAIANEGGIEGRYIGRINIYDSHTTIDLPEGMPEDVFKTLSRTRVCNQPLAIEKMTKEEAAEEARTSPRGPRGPRPSFDREGGRPSGSRDRDDRAPREGFRSGAREDSRPARPARPAAGRDFDSSSRPPRAGAPSRSTTARPARYTNSDGGFATRRESFAAPADAAERPSRPRPEGTREAGSYDRKPRPASGAPRRGSSERGSERGSERSSGRESFVEPTFAPRSFEDRPARSADTAASKAAKDKKRGGPKVRADKDKGKRRAPIKKS